MMKQSKEEFAKENAKLKEKVKVIEDVSSSAGKNDKEKDAIISVCLPIFRNSNYIVIIAR